jgi:hypothetical protein
MLLAIGLAQSAFAAHLRRVVGGALHLRWRTG